MKVEAAGTDRGCYSGDGPEHWIIADGVTSNRVTWDARQGGSGQVTGQVMLAKGAEATQGFWYDVRLCGFASSAAVSVVCRDSVDPDGFKTFDVRTDGNGNAHVEKACYSADGPDHWVTANDAASGRLTW